MPGIDVAGLGCLRHKGRHLAAGRSAVWAAWLDISIAWLTHAPQCPRLMLTLLPQPASELLQVFPNQRRSHEA
ncbi:hypothetical protein ACRRTK_001588 [Alexandromys fortis]